MVYILDRVWNLFQDGMFLYKARLVIFIIVKFYLNTFFLKIVIHIHKNY